MRVRMGFVCVGIGLLLEGSARAQVEDLPCVPRPLLWREILTGKASVGMEGEGAARTVASSVLQASRGLGCTYGASNLVDGDRATAWAEGSPGFGIGDVFLAPISGPRVEIWSGYGKSEALFADNARPRLVEVVLLGQGSEVPVLGSFNEHLPVLGRRTVELRDLYGWQALPLPAPSGGVQGGVRRPAFVAVRILSVYPGERYTDTCVSEIRSGPRSPRP